MMSQSKASDTALVCALDICRAATRIRPNPDNEMIVHALALDIAHEIKVRPLFSSKLNTSDRTLVPPVIFRV